MKLIIKLDDETYKDVMDRTEFDTLSLGIKLIEAVQNGTPLPKGHGDLIDSDKMIKELNEGIQRLDESRNEILKQLGEPEENNQIPLWMWKGCCKTCGVIIEADKGE